VFLLTMLALTVAFFGELVGSTDPVKVWAPITTYLAAILIGVAWALYLRARRPYVYAVIGHGDKAPLIRRAPGLIPSPRSGGDRDRDLTNGPRHSYLNR
jgi:hypothetical protein